MYDVHAPKPYQAKRFSIQMSDVFSIISQSGSLKLEYKSHLNNTVETDVKASGRLWNCNFI